MQLADMRSLIYLLLLASMNAVGDDGVYYCIGEDANGFQWEEAQYQRSSFIASKFKIQIDGMRITVKGRKIGDGSYACETPYQTHPQFRHCTHNFSSFDLNTETGQFTSSQANGWLLDNSDGLGGDSMLIEYGKCDKFD